MALTLPYSTMSAGFAPTGAATVDQFNSITVHSDSAHNNPHAKLLANDTALAAGINTLETTVNNTPQFKSFYDLSVFASTDGTAFTSQPVISPVDIPASTFSSFYYVEVEVDTWTGAGNVWGVGVFTWPTPTPTVVVSGVGAYWESGNDPSLPARFGGSNYKFTGTHWSGGSAPAGKRDTTSMKFKWSGVDLLSLKTFNFYASLGFAQLLSYHIRIYGI